jgi:hypothetical protein
MNSEVLSFAGENNERWFVVLLFLNGNSVKSGKKV